MYRKIGVGSFLAELENFVAVGFVVWFWTLVAVNVHETVSADVVNLSSVRTVDRNLASIVS